jgi:hypothetical protein
VRANVDLYLPAGLRLVWLADPCTQTVEELLPDSFEPRGGTPSRLLAPRLTMCWSLKTSRPVSVCRSRMCSPEPGEFSCTLQGLRVRRAGKSPACRSGLQDDFASYRAVGLIRKCFLRF